MCNIFQAKSVTDNQNVICDIFVVGAMEEIEGTGGFWNMEKQLLEASHAPKHRWRAVVRPRLELAPTRFFTRGLSRLGPPTQAGNEGKKHAIVG
jgi:hypothetical protein